MPEVFEFKKHKKLESDDRKKLLPADRIIDIIGLEKDMKLVDIGSGTGFFAIPFSKIVGNNGIIYALDISKDMVEFLESRIKNEKIENIATKLIDVENFHSPDNFFDKVFMSMVFHEVDNKEDYLKRIYNLLKRDGKIHIIEFKKKVSDKGPSFETRVSTDEISTYLLENGFVDIEIIDYNEDIYIVNSKKGSGYYD